MKNKIIILLITLMTIVPSAFAESKFEVSNELKAAATVAVKMAVLVVVSSIVIAVGLWIYKQILDKKKAKSTDSKAEKYTCEIDDTQTIDEAINTFLTINKN